MKRFLTGRWPARPRPCRDLHDRRRHHHRGDVHHHRRLGHRPAGRPVWPPRVRRTECPHPVRRKVIRTLLRVTERRGVLRTAGQLVWPLHAHHLVVAAFCDGARSSNDYSSGRRERLEAAVEIRSPELRTSPASGSSAMRPAGPRRLTRACVTRFPVVCMPHRLRTVKTHLGPNFTPNNASRCLRILDVTPFTMTPLVASQGPIYRRDVSSRYISSVHRPGTGLRKSTR